MNRNQQSGEKMLYWLDEWSVFTPIPVLHIQLMKI